MDDGLNILNEALAAGVEVKAVAGELRIKTKDEAWLDRLQPHKAAILAHLNGEPSDSELAKAIDDPPEPALRWQPFPTHLLPGTVGRYVQAASDAIGCDASFVALPLLASLARAIGNSRVIRLKRTWTEPAILWAAVIGKSGTHKTPSLQAAMKFLDRKQSESIASNIEALRRYEAEIAEYTRSYEAWKKSKSEELPPWKPEPPTCTRYTTSDCTIEALAALLAVQFDGLLVSRDELAGWLGGIAEYKGGKGSDLGHWLACWSAQPLTVDRKTGTTKMIHVPRAAVSLIGGIQPAVLKAAIGREHMQDGLCARLLMAMPDPKPVVWTDAEIDADVEQAMSQVFERLIELEPAGAAGFDDFDDEAGEPEPFPLDLTPEAKTVWVKYFNRHRAELADLDDDLAAAWSKLEAYTARFALIFQLCTFADGDAAAGHAVDQRSMEAAIELTDWFGHEAKRVYGMFVETAEDRDQRDLVDWIERRGGTTTVRDLQMTLRQYRPKGKAEAALEALVDSGLAHRETVRTGRRPRTDYVLTTAPTPTLSRESAVSANNVGVGSVGASKNGHPEGGTK